MGGSVVLVKSDFISYSHQSSAWIQNLRWDRVWQKCKIVVTDNICRPGHGAPTGDIRKKKFTEHQINKERGIQKSHSTFSLDNSADFVPSYPPPAKYSSELDLQEGVSLIL